MQCIAVVGPSPSVQAPGLSATQRAVLVRPFQQHTGVAPVHVREPQGDWGDFHSHVPGFGLSGVEHSNPVGQGPPAWHACPNAQSPAAQWVYRFSESAASEQLRESVGGTEPHAELSAAGPYEVESGRLPSSGFPDSRSAPARRARWRGGDAGGKRPRAWRSGPRRRLGTYESRKRAAVFHDNDARAGVARDSRAEPIVISNGFRIPSPIAQADATPPRRPEQRSDRAACRTLDRRARARRMTARRFASLHGA